MEQDNTVKDGTEKTKPLQEKPEETGLEETGLEMTDKKKSDTEMTVKEKSDKEKSDTEMTVKETTEPEIPEEEKTGEQSRSEANAEIDKGEIVVDIEHLKKSFGKSEILKDINLKIKKGETIVTLGKSGTGKSVTLKCIVGLIAPDSGKVKVLGKNIPDLSYEALQYMRKKIGFVFQSGALYDSMSVRQNLEFPLMRNTDLSKEEIDKKVEEVLKDVGLSQAIDKMPSELSGGMRKRIGVARTIIMNPEIMLWDEPTTGLDPETTRDISHLIVRMQRKYKVSSIVVTHDMICAKIVANKIVVLNDGKYTESGTYDELEQSKDEFVRTFFEEVKDDATTRLSNYEGDEDKKSLKTKEE